MTRCKFHKKAVRLHYSQSGDGHLKAWVECDYCNRKVRGFKVTVSGTKEYPIATAYQGAR